jgi:hypothetical protein
MFSASVSLSAREQMSAGLGFDHKIAAPPATAPHGVCCCLSCHPPHLNHNSHRHPCAIALYRAILLHRGLLSNFPDDYRNDLPKIQNVLGSTRGNLETGYISS